MTLSTTRWQLDGTGHHRGLGLGGLMRRTQVDADGHRAQRVRRRDQGSRVLHRTELNPEVGTVVLCDFAHLFDQRN